MNHTTPWDHLFALIVFVVIPIYSHRVFPAFVRRVQIEGQTARISGYRETIAIWATSALMLCGLWIGLGRSWADLGVRSSSPLRVAIAIAIGSALIWLVIRQFSTPEKKSKDEFASQLGDLAALLPHTAREEWWFRLVAVNAGITEELIFRAFLLWYLEPLAGMFAAAALTIVLFTLGHAYQGIAAVPGIAFVSFVFVVLYLVSGSIFVPIIVHALLDLLQGRTLFKLIEKAEQVPVEETPIPMPS